MTDSVRIFLPCQPFDKFSKTRRIYKFYYYRQMIKRCRNYFIAATALESLATFLEAVFA